MKSERSRSRCNHGCGKNRHNSTKETRSRQQNLRQINYSIKSETAADGFVDITSAKRQDASSVAAFQTQSHKLNNEVLIFAT